MIDIHMMCYRPKIRDYDSKPSVAQPAEVELLEFKNKMAQSHLIWS